jgi:glucokinase-like ROK family protein
LSEAREGHVISSSGADVAETPSDLDARKQVLHAVRVLGARSRNDVATATGLGRAAVGQRLTELSAAGLIEDAGSGPSTGGRPPRRLRFRAEAGHILVADLGATSIDVAVADLSSGILAHRAEEADIAAGPHRVLERVESLFDELGREVPAGYGPLWGIGIGVPGPVDFNAGRPVSPPIMPGWDGHPIREQLSQRHGVPVWVDNDVNIRALGEWRRGIAMGHGNVVWIKVGTGIGAGLISNGVLHRGADGAAGDVGHVPVVDEGVVCRCGNIGCLEALAGGGALARDADMAARSGRSQWLADALERDGVLTAKSVALGASHGDAVCVELLQRSARLIGHMLATVVNLLNPSLVVIGGGVSHAGNLFLATIRETVYRRSLPLATRALQIELSGLGEDAGVIGAATMVADELLGAGLDLLPASVAAAG